MNAKAVLALIRLELRRGTAHLPHMALTILASLLLLWLAGVATPTRVGLLLSIFAATFVMQPPMAVTRDKLDGGLEFLVSLPVSPTTLAVGRLASVALFCIPGALGLALTLAVAPPTEELATLPGGPWDALLGLYVVLAVGGLLGTGMALRLRVEHMSWLFVGGLAGLALSSKVGARILPHPRQALMAFLAHPWAPFALWLGGMALLGLLALLAFYLARSGYARFTPGRDRITW